MSKKPAGDDVRATADARWRSMRRYIVPRQLLNPLVAFEDELKVAEPLLNPHARKTKSFVARFNESPDGEQTRTAFEQVVASAEKICRQWRKEKNYADYDDPVLQPRLDTLASPPPLDAARARMFGNSPHGQKIIAQRDTLKQFCASLQHYADSFGSKVNADRLWNAYRVDFRGLDAQAFDAHAFVWAFPKTMQLLRPLVRTYRLEKAVRDIENGTQEQIIAVAAKLRTQLPDSDVLRSGPLGKHLDVLADATPRQPCAPDLYYAHEEEAADAAEEKFVHSMKHYREAMKQEIDSQNKQFGKTGVNSGLRHAYARNFKQELLTAYKADAKMLYKKDANGAITNQSEIDAALRAAPHLEPLISDLRAQAALTKFEAIVEKNMHAIIGLYDPARAAGRSS